MLRKIALPIFALVVMLALVCPPQAQAKVHFGVYVGPGYTYPAYPYAYSNPYPNPYYYSSPYPAYPYAAPYYGYPYGGYGFYWGGGHRDHDHWRDRGHEWHERGHFGGHEGHERR